MEQKELFLTRDGLNNLKSEYEHLMSVKRIEVAQRIQRAKELGNIDNNAEYDDAKNEQAFVEGRILTLEGILKKATIVEEKPSGRVKIGSRVTVKRDDGMEEIYTIVGSAEADPLQQKISNESPVGKALLGKKTKETVEVRVPAGTIKFKIVRIG